MSLLVREATVDKSGNSDKLALLLYSNFSANLGSKPSTKVYGHPHPVKRVKIVKRKRTDRLTPEQERRILKNKTDIDAGKGREFSSIDEYIKTLKKDLKMEEVV
jgi:hypothetical protein